MALVHAEIVAAVGHKHIELLERTFVEEHLDTFAGRVFAFGVLSVDTLLATAKACGFAVFDQFVDLFLNLAHIFSVYLFLFSQSSVRMPWVDLGCRKAIVMPSAPLRGVLSIRRMPLASASESCSSMFSQASAMW